MNMKKDKRSLLEKEIDAAIASMAELSADSDEYAKIARNVEMLCKAKSYEKKSFVSPDTVIAVVANLLGIGLVIGYEQANVIRTKAMGMIIRPRV